MAQQEGGGEVWARGWCRRRRRRKRRIKRQMGECG
jgi:hypothetical protein